MKITIKANIFFLFISLIIMGTISCHQQIETDLNDLETSIEVIIPNTKKYLHRHTIDTAVTIKNYFEFMDDLVAQYDSITPYQLSEYVLVRANPWIIDSLANTDYYRLMKKGLFVYDQKEIIILEKGNVLFIPTLTIASEIFRQQADEWIDINIPEFKLRIKNRDEILFTFPIRVGQNRTRYLATAKREVDLRTHTGEGKIYKVKRDPTFVNPVDGKHFIHTRRDDKRLTLMPLIPWLGTEINGRHYGEMIHPTTNPKSLGKAYSNGCIGTKEADAWYIYYYAPINTKVVIRYNLNGVDEKGQAVRFKNIYSKPFRNFRDKKKQPK